MTHDIVYSLLPDWIFAYVGPANGYTTPILQHRRSEIVQWWQKTWQALAALPQLFIAV